MHGGAAGELFRTGVKGLLVAYILLTPMLSVRPVRPFVESTLFVVLYCCAVVAIAPYDAVAAALLTVVLTVWIIQNTRCTVSDLREQLHTTLHTDQEQSATQEALHDRGGVRQESQAGVRQESQAVHFVSPAIGEAKYFDAQQTVQDIEDSVYDSHNARMVLQPLGAGHSAQGISSQRGEPLGANAYEPTLFEEYRPF